MRFSPFCVKIMKLRCYGSPIKTLNVILEERSEILFQLGTYDFSTLCVDSIDKLGIRWYLFV